MSHLSGGDISSETGRLARFRVWLLPAAGLVGGAAAVVATPAAGQLPLACYAAAAEGLLLIGAAQAVRQRQAADTARRSAGETARAADDREAALAQDVANLCGAVIPWAIGRLAEGASPDAVAEQVRQDAADSRLSAEAQSQIVRLVLAAEERHREYARQLDDAVSLVEQELPRAVKALYGGEDLEDLLASYQTGSAPQWHLAILRAVLEAEDRGAGRHESAMRAFVLLGQRMQSVLHRVLRRLDELQQQHHANPLVFGILQDLDRRLSLAGRLGDSIVVVGGGRSGQQWSQPVPLFNVLRGAMARMGDEFLRVQLEEGGIPRTGVIGSSVQPLVHLFAELLHNAAQYSPPSTKVRVTTEQVHHGIVVEIDDAGVGLSTEKALWANEVLSGRRDPTVEDLGETPQFGLAVVGRQSARLGVEVSLQRSGRGGTRVSVFLPHALLADLPEQPAVGMPGATPVAEPPVPSDAGTSARAGQSPLVSGRTAGGLPRRRVDQVSAEAPARTPIGRSGEGDALVTGEQRRMALAAFSRRRPAARPEAAGALNPTDVGSPVTEEEEHRED